MLITNIAQLRAASSINISNNIDTWLPYIADAEAMFIIPVLGEDNYTILDEYANSSGSGNGIVEMDAVLLMIRKAVSLYAFYLGIDEIAVSISAAGIQVIQSDTHKPAPQYQIMNLKETYLMRAHRQIDFCLKYMNLHQDNIGTAIVAPQCFFKDADMFQKYFDIHGSRRVFLTLLPIIRSIELKYIRPTVSDEYFNDLRVKSGQPDVVLGGSTKPSEYDSDDLAVMEFVLPAIAHLTVARALLDLSIDYLDWGIFNNSVNTFNSIQNKTQAATDKIAAMHLANQRDGEAELKMLQEFLDNTASDGKYPLYFASSRFIGKENAVKRGEFLNSADSSIFIA